MVLNVLKSNAFRHPFTGHDVNMNLFLFICNYIFEFFLFVRFPVFQTKDLYKKMLLKYVTCIGAVA